MSNLFDPNMVTNNPNAVVTAPPTNTPTAPAVPAVNPSDLMALAILAQGLNQRPNFQITKNPGINNLINSGLNRVAQAAQSPAERMFSQKIQQENRANLARALQLMAAKRQQAQLLNLRLQQQQHEQQMMEQYRQQELQNEQDQRNATADYRQHMLDLETQRANKQPKQSEEQSFVSDFLNSNKLPNTSTNRLRAIKAYRTLGQRPLKGSTKYGPDNPAPQSAFDALNDSKKAALVQQEAEFNQARNALFTKAGIDPDAAMSTWTPELRDELTQLNNENTAAKQAIQNKWETSVRKLGGSVKHYSYFNPQGPIVPTGATPGTLNGKHGYVLNGKFYPDGE